MEGSSELTLQIAIAVLAGISAQVVGEYLRVPSIVFLLLFGILLGSDCLFKTLSVALKIQKKLRART